MCDEGGAYEPVQCHGSTGYCWCVDPNGQEISGTRSEPGSRPMCEETTGCYDWSAAPRRLSLRGGVGLLPVLTAAFAPLGIDHGGAVPPVGPTPRPDVQPLPPGTHLLFTQSGRIEHVPLDGYTMQKDGAKAVLHLPVSLAFPQQPLQMLQLLPLKSKTILSVGRLNGR